MHLELLRHKFRCARTDLSALFMGKCSWQWSDRPGWVPNLEASRTSLADSALPPEYAVKGMFPEREGEASGWRRRNVLVFQLHLAAHFHKPHFHFESGSQTKRGPRETDKSQALLGWIMFKHKFRCWFPIEGTDFWAGRVIIPPCWWHFLSYGYRTYGYRTYGSDTCHLRLLVRTRNAVPRTA